MGEHTSPKPWAIRDLAVVDRDGRIVCEPTRGPDAEDIVRCVSVHDDLLEACKAAVAYAASAVNPASRLPNYKAMQAAIAKAKPPTIEVKR